MMKRRHRGEVEAEHLCTTRAERQSSRSLEFLPCQIRVRKEEQEARDVQLASAARGGTPEIVNSMQLRLLRGEQLFFKEIALRVLWSGKN